MPIHDKRICPICGRQFTANNPMQKYCSDACVGAARRRYRTEYQKRYRQKIKGGLAREVYENCPVQDQQTDHFIGRQWLDEFRAEAEDPEALKNEKKRRRDFLNGKKNPVGTITDAETIRGLINDRVLKYVVEDLDEKQRKRLQRTYNGGRAYQDSNGQYYRLVPYKTDVPTYEKPLWKLVPVSAEDVFRAALQKPKTRPVMDYEGLIWR